MTVKWQFHDPVAGDTYTFHQNPNGMTSPYPTKGFDSGGNSRTGIVRAVMARQTTEWEFSGKLRTQAQFDAFVDWSGRQNAVQLTDHLGRTFTVYPVAFEPQDVRAVNRPWLHSYTFKVRNVV